MSASAGARAASPEREPAFEALFRGEYEDLVARAAGALGDRRGAEDVVQEAFMGLYRAWPAAPDGRAWLRRELDSRIEHARRSREDRPALAGAHAPQHAQAALRRLQERIAAERGYREPAIDFDRIGPRVGARFPDVRLPDQHGDVVDLHEARGARGAVVVFHRSALW